MGKMKNEKTRKITIKIDELFGFIEFFKSFDTQPFDVIKWKEKIYHIKHFLYELIETPRIVEHATG
jgi:hypothetical protein